MIEIFLIFFQVLFLITIFSLPFKCLNLFYDIFKRDHINTILINIIFFFNISLFFSFLNLDKIYLLLFIFLAISLNLNYFEIRNTQFIYNFKTLIPFALLLLIISLDISIKLDLGWDAKFFWYLKMLNFYEDLPLKNLQNYPANDYPHLGSFLWSFFYKYPFDFSEYFGRIFYAFFYISSIYFFLSIFRLPDIQKNIFVFLLILLTYQYKIFSGLQEVLVFSNLIVLSKILLKFTEKKTNYNHNIRFQILILLIINSTLWFKIEGFVLSFILFISFYTIFLKKKINSNLMFFGLAGIVAFKILSSKFLNISNENFQIFQNISNINLIEFAEDIKDVSFYLTVNFARNPIILISFLIIVIMLTKNNLTKDLYFLSMIYGLSICFIYAAFLFTMQDVEWQSRVGMDRVLFEISSFSLISIYLFYKRKLNDKKNKLQK